MFGCETEIFLLSFCENLDTALVGNTDSLLEQIVTILLSFHLHTKIFSVFSNAYSKLPSSVFLSSDPDFMTGRASLFSRRVPVALIPLSLKIRSRSYKEKKLTK